MAIGHGLAAECHALVTELEAGTASGALDGVAEALTEFSRQARQTCPAPAGGRAESIYS